MNRLYSGFGHALWTRPLLVALLVCGARWSGHCQLRQEFESGLATDKGFWASLRLDLPDRLDARVVVSPTGLAGSLESDMAVIGMLRRGLLGELLFSPFGAELPDQAAALGRLSPVLADDPALITRLSRIFSPASPGSAQGDGLAIGERCGVFVARAHEPEGLPVLLGQGWNGSLYGAWLAGAPLCLTGLTIAGFAPVVQLSLVSALGRPPIAIPSAWYTEAVWPHSLAWSHAMFNAAFAGLRLLVCAGLREEDPGRRLGFWRSVASLQLPGLRLAAQYGLSQSTYRLPALPSPAMRAEGTPEAVEPAAGGLYWPKGQVLPWCQRGVEADWRLLPPLTVNARWTHGIPHPESEGSHSARAGLSFALRGTQASLGAGGQWPEPPLLGATGSTTPFHLLRSARSLSAEAGFVLPVLWPARQLEQSQGQPQGQPAGFPSSSGVADTYAVSPFSLAGELAWYWSDSDGYRLDCGLALRSGTALLRSLQCALRWTAAGPAFRPELRMQFPLAGGSLELTLDATGFIRTMAEPPESAAAAAAVAVPDPDSAKPRLRLVYSLRQ